jgi:hypothetical protein
MPTTAEVRWFFEGPVPDEIERWFCRGGLALAAAPREDHYVTFPASLGLNVKLREGRLEIKTLVKTLGPRSFTADVAGNVQVWEKQFSEDTAFTEFERLRTSAPHLWVAVGKERTLRKFSLNGNSLKEVDAGQVFLSEGCNVELTKIAVAGSDHWSLAFEAYGDPARVEGILMKAATHLMTNLRYSSGRFSANNSHSYPEWLERFLKKA